MKPAYCIISADNSRYHICYYKENGKTATKTGYGPGTFQDLNSELPVIDYRTAVVDRIVTFIMKNDCADTSPGVTAGLPVRYYLQEAGRQTGATITSVGEIITQKEAAR